MAPPGPAKIGHKKDGHQRRPHRFHVSRPPPLTRPLDPLLGMAERSLKAFLSTAREQQIAPPASSVLYRLNLFHQYGTCTRARSQWEGCIQSKSTWLMFIYLFSLRR